MSFDGQHNHSKIRGSSRGPSDVLLQIGPSGKPTRQFPAVIRNLRAGVASLEVSNPLALMEWEDLNGQGGRLRVPANVNGEPVNFPGKVVRVRHCARSRDKGLLSIDLVLDQPTAAAQKLLNEHIPNCPRDIQGLWERWDQARQPSAQRAALPTRLGFAGVTLLFCGLIMHTGRAGSHPLIAWIFWLMGTLGVVGQILLLWKGIKDSS
ncbi:MAG: hypothetical protein ACLPT6_05095 [Desulfobaccales bacterium]